MSSTAPIPMSPPLPQRALSAGRAGRWAIALAIGLGAVIAVEAALSWTRAGIYVDDLTLSADALAHQPEDPRIANNLGFAHAKQGHLPEAIHFYQEALRLRPDYAAAHNNLAEALLNSGRTEDALVHYRQAIDLDSHFAEAYYNLGNALVLSGHPAEAIAPLTRALELHPYFAEAHNNLCAALYKTGHFEEALHEARRSLELKPDNLQAWLNLVVINSNLNRPAEARSAGEKAIAVARAQNQFQIADQLEAFLKGDASAAQPAPRATELPPNVLPP